ncbi:hypothetical protein F8154_01505 [Alkaliphilus pronyensis]|uniref:Cell division protein FtsL n=1 Tax=Alkaliphilus pronyensis TaxID=1482732 RepID=A0A6I0FH85_9FIRM|nr:septum formation initiator family protein [Alkaliphilus pronyensis]KAB3538596.1 hypothetical protein F8154_01505 [Alkaliphilus pronyensis]
MEVVRKDYLPHVTEEKQHNHQIKRPKKQKKNKFRLLKVATACSISCLLMLGLVVVVGYASTTELKHEILSLNKQLEEVEANRDKLKVELEKLSKSRWIEAEAEGRLGMVYPLPENTYYFSVNSTKVSLLTNELNNNMNDKESTGPDKDGFLSRTISKFVALLNI